MARKPPRLRLLPFAPAHYLTLIERPEHFEHEFGLPVAPGLRDLLVSGEVSPSWLAALRLTTAHDPWTHGFAVVLPPAQLVIGTAGFKGPPDDRGVVEIAYGIAPAHRNQGYATEAAAALVALASADPRVRLIRAHTLPTQSPSTRVLTKCGFTKVADVTDPEDGPVWRWERTAGAATPAPPGTALTPQRP